MSQIQFKSLDLNLFKVLLALLETRSVTVAAAQLSLTPSAVSHALSRLRTGLDDPLFERRAGALTPTPYAVEVGRQAAAALRQLELGVQRQSFDAATAEREFVLAAGAYSIAVLLPNMIDRLRLAAPKVRLRVRRIEGQYAEDVERRRVDVAVGAPGPLTRRLEWRPLARDDMVWVARRGHPFVRAPLTEEALARASHVVVDKFATVLSEEFQEVRRFLDVSSEVRSAHDAAMRVDGQSNPAAVVVPDLANAVEIVRRSDCVTLTIRRYAEVVAPGELQLLEPPHRTPPIELGLIYHRDRLGDPGFEWLLGLLSETNRTLGLRPAS